ncbi:MAG: hypothetical protein A2W33_00480 [Chloroflexi bacterium RBG_16_52_11]|nr:MAG: hypothetical protein A2W33_00480 [Chloroflexi bacterium RBG_16_52_11]
MFFILQNWLHYTRRFFSRRRIHLLNENVIKLGGAIFQKNRSSLAGFEKALQVTLFSQHTRFDSRYFCQSLLLEYIRSRGHKDALRRFASSCKLRRQNQKPASFLACPHQIDNTQHFTSSDIN